MGLYGYALVVEAGAAGRQALSQLAEQVAPRADDLEAVRLDLRGGLLDVAEVGQEEALVGADQGGAVGPAEAGQPADVDEVGDQQRGQLTLAQPVDDAVAARAAHSSRSSFARRISSASR